MTRVLITGGKGQLGHELVERFERRLSAQEVVAVDLDELDVTDRRAVLAFMDTTRPQIVVHAAAMTRVDDCEDRVEDAFKINTLATRWVYEGSRSSGSKMCYVSTDYVFDGLQTTPYTEWDQPRPVSVYGMSKLAGEKELGSDALIVRTSWVVGRFGQNMVKTILRLAAQPGDLKFVYDQIGSPTVASDLAEAIVGLCLEGRIGIYNVTNSGVTSWYDLARFVLEEAGYDPERVKPISSAELPSDRKAPRPAYSVLAPTALRLSGTAALPDWRDSVGELVRYLINTSN